MTAEREGLVELLAEHVTVGGTYWDHERKTTYAKCQCGAPCYLVGQHEPTRAQHLADALADLLAARDRRVRGEAVARCIDLAEEWESIAMVDEWDAADRWADAPKQLRAAIDGSDA